MVLIFLVTLQEEMINNEVEFLLLASDGLWDVVSNQVCCVTSLLFDVVKD
jgi:serine/threonine protein phosphatase PrpC